MPLPFVTDATAERVAHAPDFSDEKRWRQLPPEVAALVRTGLVEAARIRRQATEVPVDPAETFLRGIELAVATLVEQAASDQFAEDMQLASAATTA